MFEAIAAGHRVRERESSRRADVIGDEDAMVIVLPSKAEGMLGAIVGHLNLLSPWNPDPSRKDSDFFNDQWHRGEELGSRNADPDDNDFWIQGPSAYGAYGASGLVHVGNTEVGLWARDSTDGCGGPGGQDSRDVRGEGGYIYRQNADGSIRIMAGPTMEGKLLERGRAWKAITDEIGEYPIAYDNIDDEWSLSPAGGLECGRFDNGRIREIEEVPQFRARLRPDERLGKSVV